MTDDPKRAPSPQDGADRELLGAPVERAAYRDLLANTRFRNLFFAMLSSSLGDWIGLFAILALTESILGPTRAGAFALSGIMVARVVPTLALGPVAGVFVDRWDRKRTLIATDIGRGIVMALVALAGDIFQLVVATLLIEVMSTLFIPAKDATLPNLVRKERLVQANQLSLVVTYGTLPIGAAVFALLVGASNTFLSGIPLLAERPAAIAIWINAATFFVSAVFIARLDVGESTRRSTSRVKQGDAPGAWADLKEGFEFITGHPMVRALVIGVMGAFAAAGVVASGVGKLFATIVNSGDSGFGVLGAVVGAGLLTGLLAAGRAARRFTKERLFAPGIAIAGVSLILTAFSPRLDIATIPAYLMGAGAGLSFVTGYTMLQERSSDEVRGRTFASFNTGVRAALFASLVIGPALAGVIGIEQQGSDGVYSYAIGGVRITLMLAGVVALVGAVWTGRTIDRLLASSPGVRLASRDDAPVSTRPGLFVVFEGGEGAGKSTQMSLLLAALSRQGHDALVTREPGGTDVGEEVRSLLLDPHGTVGDRAEALLYAAARAQHVEEVIRPRLEQGTVVLCDRYVDSSIVYQGIARGLGVEDIVEINRWGTGGLAPDLVVLLDIAAEEGLRRAGSRPDRLEAAGLPFHQRVNEGFRTRATAEPDRYLTIDATRQTADLHDEILTAVLARLDALRPVEDHPTVPSEVGVSGE